MAEGPDSEVRMRTTLSTGSTKIFAVADFSGARCADGGDDGIHLLVIDDHLDFTLVMNSTVNSVPR